MFNQEYSSAFKILKRQSEDLDNLAVGAQIHININYIKDMIVPLAPILKFLSDKAAFHAKPPLQWKTAKIVTFNNRKE